MRKKQNDGNRKTTRKIASEIGSWSAGAGHEVCQPKRADIRGWTCEEDANRGKAMECAAFRGLGKMLREKSKTLI